MRTAKQLDEDRAAIMNLLQHPAVESPRNVQMAQALALVYVGDAVRDLADMQYTVEQAKAAL